MPSTCSPSPTGRPLKRTVPTRTALALRHALAHTVPATPRG